MPYDIPEHTKRANRTMAIVLTVLVILPFFAFVVLIIDDVIK